MLESQLAIKQLENKIDDLKQLTKKENISIDNEIKMLQLKLNKTMEERWKSITSWERVQLARGFGRPNSMAYINNLFDDFIELHGDRSYRDDAAIVGGIGLFNGLPVTIIGQQKGSNTKENIERNFGMPHPEGYRKALRLMKQAEKFNRPIICFVDTQGAYCGVGAEERGQGEAIARNLMEMINLSVPILSIIIGEGGSGGALALAVSDEVWMLENAIYSILSPEGFASILWKDSSRAKEAAEVMKLTARELLDLNIIERIINEPVGGVQIEAMQVYNKLREGIKEFLFRYRSLDKEELLDRRYNRYRIFGVE